MASNTSVRFVPSSTYKTYLLNSDPVMRLVDELAEQVRTRASSMYGAERYVVKKAVRGPKRCHAVVATGDLHAIRSNAKHMTLLKSIKG